MKSYLITAVAFAAVFTAGPVLAQSDNSAKTYAPGQKSGTAKQNAPGQVKSEGESAKQFAPGQVKKEDDTATKQKHSGDSSGATGATKKGKVENSQ